MAAVNTLGLQKAAAGLGALGTTLSSAMKAPPKLPQGAATAAQRLKSTQGVGSVGGFNQATQGVKLTPFVPMSMAGAIKQSFATSQYSGALSEGIFPARSPRAMASATNLPSQQMTTKVSGDAPPWEEEGTPEHFPRTDEKHASLSRALRNALEAVGEWQQKQAMAVTPVQKLRQTRMVGAPKLTPPPGPSIQQIAKPVGFGKPLAGTTKTH